MKSQKESLLTHNKLPQDLAMTYDDGLTKQQRYRNKMIEAGFLVRTYYVHKDDEKKVLKIIQSRMKSFAIQRIAER